jgi:hypothetical protein
MFETASLIDNAARLIELQIAAVGPMGAAILAVAGVLWSCSTWFVVSECRRLRRPRRPAPHDLRGGPSGAHRAGGPERGR